MSQRHRAVYAISVAAELVSMQVQNLRVYERHGLVSPARTEGGTRRYSQADVDRLHRVRELLEEGLNLAGIAQVLRLESEVARLRVRLAQQEERVGGSAGVDEPTPPRRG
jgi:MerR family transcriptional regulator, heat shock protein HspR